MCKRQQVNNPYTVLNRKTHGMKKRLNEEQFKAYLRPMYTSSIAFGYATPEKVEKNLDLLWRNELAIRDMARVERRSKIMKEVKAIMFWTLFCALFLVGSCIILTPNSKQHKKQLNQTSLPYSTP